MTKTILSILSLTAALSFGLPTNLALAQYDSLRGNCFTTSSGTFNCTGWDVTDMQASLYAGAFEVIELHPDRNDYPMIRVFALNDNSFVVEEYDEANGMWQALPYTFYADTDDPECVLGGPEMIAACFRPF